MIDYGLDIGLGPLDDLDLETIRSWRNDYRVWRYTRQNDLISREQQTNWYIEQDQDPSVKMYSIAYLPEAHRKIVGVTGLTSINWTNRTAEFSLYIAPQFRKKTYGNQALITLLSHGFACLNLNCIWGETFAYNPAREIFRKVGFTVEGTRRQFYYREGKYIDAEIFSMLKSDWEENETFDVCRLPCFTLVTS